jgi:phosphoribosylformylglycinamidine synthase
VIRRYDHEVQGGTAVKPLVGVHDHGPSDATVIVPQDALTPQPPLPQGEGEPTSRDTIKGLAVSNGINPLYGEFDPYVMAWAAVDEAVRNLVAVGADPDQIALLDNFCWGNPNLPDRLGSLVRCAQGCYDAAVAYGAPFISGKDSLNNEYADVDGQRHAIPGTLLISAIGIVPDVDRTVTMDLKAVGNDLYLIGETRAELGGSHYHLVHGLADGAVPQPQTDALKTYRLLHSAIQAGMVQSCHDCSEGGLAVSLAEMCIAGSLGAAVQLDGQLSAAGHLFSESLSRLIVEVRPEVASAFEDIMCGVVVQQIGMVTADGALVIRNRGGAVLVEKPIVDLERAWRGEAVRALMQSSGLPEAPLQNPVDDNSIVGARRALPLQNEIQRKRVPAAHTEPPRVLIVHANGTNRDHDAALALEIAGGQPEIVHVNQLLNGERRLLDYHMLVVPGGFSYGDELGAGKLWAVDFRQRLRADVERFVSEGRPVLGICNGFQALVKAGLLPGDAYNADGHHSTTLTFNQSGHFECRWVYLQANPGSVCLFTEGLDEPIHCPVAHGEGRLLTTDQAALNRLWADGLVALTYVNADGSEAAYPANPNGSLSSIAGLCNAAGNVLGLMPHPEDHIFPWQHPRWRRGERGMDGLRLFKNGIKYA